VLYLCALCFTMELAARRRDHVNLLSLVALAVVAATAVSAAGGKTRPPVIIPEACQRAWYRAVDGGVSLAYDRASQYFTDLKSADPDQDGVFTKSEFVDACKRGLLRDS